MIIPHDIYRRIAYITSSVAFYGTMNTSRIFMIAAIAAVTLAFTVGSMVPVLQEAFAQCDGCSNSNEQGDAGRDNVNQQGNAGNDNTQSISTS
jgi:hypothetical protein